MFNLTKSVLWVQLGHQVKEEKEYGQVILKKRTNKMKITKT
jgi:hypothetical protein